MTNLHYNCLGCPQCSNPLHDSLYSYERNKRIKTVACSNSTCDFVGKRDGFQLLTKLQEQTICQNNQTIQYAEVLLNQ